VTRVACTILLTALAAVGCTSKNAAPHPELRRDASALLQLSRQGGIAGLTEFLSIAPDGTVSYQNHGSAYREKLAATDLQLLADAIAKGDYRLDGSSDAPNPPPHDWLDVDCWVRRDRETVKIELDRGPIAAVVDAIEQRAETSLSAAGS